MVTNSSGYDFVALQKKWNKRWEGLNLGRAEDFSDKPKLYTLVELPYPSGSGLHMGHCWNYTLFDAYSRYHRLLGYNVLYPMGWDAFGLPTYNHAIKVGKDPHDVSVESIATFKRQLKELGLAFDWEREIDSSAPEYYKWTQWIFIQLYEHWYDESFPRKDGGKGQARPISDLPIPKEISSKGEKEISAYKDLYRLAYKAKMPVFWCPKCKTGLANEEVLGDGTHERCGVEVEKRDLEQWMLRITAYAERLLEDLDLVDFPNGVKAAQKGWIGKRDGITISYEIVDKNIKIDCFTTTPVNFGATFLAVAPEYKGLMDFVKPEFVEDVKKYLREVKQKTEIDRVGAKVKTGVFTGSYAKNHVTGEEIPIWIADFVLSSVGTGAIQGCPAHDRRDWDFAKKYSIDIKFVAVPVGVMADEFTEASGNKPFVVHRGDSAIMINSEFLNDLDFTEAMEKTMDYFEEKGWGKRTTVYQFHDWVFSRQHYWGEPTPMVYCKECGWNPVPMNHLPITLPKLQDYRMGDDGSSPLEKAEEWIQTNCPVCNQPARRETDVMPNWAGSNWYFLRYLDPHNKEKLVDHGIASYWMPVDLYYGGQEHVTLHLLYSRFIYKFLYDLGTVPGPEPYKIRRNHGIILGPDNRKMSKSWGNVVNPDEVVGKYGADVVRLYMMFIGPYESVTPWNDRSVIGVYRFVSRLYKKLNEVVKMVNEGDNTNLSGDDVDIEWLKCKVDGDIKSLKFNTIVASLMEFLNKNEKLNWNMNVLKEFIVLLSSFTPYLAEEMWERMGEKGSVHQQTLIVSKEAQVKSGEIQLPVMINGKLRTKVLVSANATEEEVVNKAASEAPQYLTDGYKKVIYVPAKMVNFVVE